MNFRDGTRGAGGPVRPAVVVCAVGGLFVLSGAAGLVHETAWVRMLRVVMGNTTLATSTVLAVFMGGLGLGSFLAAGRLGRRGDPLLVFAGLEAVVGLYCLALPTLISATRPVYRQFYESVDFGTLSLIRFGLCTTLLLLPSACMGATLPVLTRFSLRSADGLGRSVGRLYAINTFGAVLGAAAAGFVLLPTSGLWATICWGAAVNLAVAAGAAGLWFAVGRGERAAAGREDAAGETSGSDEAVSAGQGVGGRRAVAALLLAYAVASGTSMIYELCWTRVFSLMIGSSVYGFSLILCAFVTGIAVGSAVCARFVDRVKEPCVVLAAVLAGVGLSSAAVVPLLGVLPYFAMRLIAAFADSFWLLQAALFASAAVLMLVPTALMGAGFPLATRAYAGLTGRGVGSVGRVYGANTVGAIAGSFLGGFVLVPTLGAQDTLGLAAVLSVTAGLAIYLLAAVRVTSRRWAVGGVALAAAVGGVLVTPRWDPLAMNSGPFLLAMNGGDGADLRELFDAALAEREIVYHGEGLTSSVTVMRTADERLWLTTGGRVEATSTGGQRQQRLLAHMPLLLHPDPEPESALVIGLASGVTLGTTGLYPLERLDCVELSAEVVEATRLFSEFNHDVLEDPRVDLLVADGRGHVRNTSRRYDVIISQPSDPTVAGVADLFTAEFFAECRDRLNDDGTICVWLKTDTVDVETCAGVLKSFTSVFADTLVWTATDYEELLVVGGMRPFRVTPQELARRMRRPGIAEDLAGIAVWDVPDLMSMFLADADRVDAVTRDVAFHADDDASLEFAAALRPEGGHETDSVAAALIGSWTPDDPAAEVVSLRFLSDADHEPEATPNPFSEVALARSGSVARIWAERAASRAGRLFERARIDEGLTLLKRAAELDADGSRFRASRARQILDEQIAAVVESGRGDEARVLVEKVLRAGVGTTDDVCRMAEACVTDGQPERAAALYRAVLGRDAGHYGANLGAAKLALAAGHRSSAIDLFRAATRADAASVEAHAGLARVLTLSARDDSQLAVEAVASAARACELTEYKNPLLLLVLAEAHRAAGDERAALRAARVGMRHADGGQVSRLLGRFETQAARTGDGRRR